jgi:hypothetical protein
MLVRTVLFPVRLGWGVGKMSAKGGYRAGRASVVGGYKAGHLLGYRRMATLGVGIGIGLLLAPTSGAELRDRLKVAMAGGGSATGGDLEPGPPGSGYRVADTLGTPQDAAPGG